MKLSSFIPTAILLLTSGIASAAPTKLYRRACPTIETMGKWIDDNKPDFGPNTIFYTAGAGSRQAESFAPTLDPAGWYWGKVWFNEGKDENGRQKPDQGIVWVGECDFGPPQEAVFPMMGQVLATKSTGTVYVIMNKGKPLNSFWKDNELPYLKDVKIIAVNADDFDDQKEYDGVF
jgi:hypothetical protein